MAASMRSGVSRIIVNKLSLSRSGIPLMPRSWSVSAPRLLCSSSGSDSDQDGKKSRVRIPQPAGRRRPGEKMRRFGEEPSVISGLAPDLVSAASQAAKSLGGDTDKTTGDLLKQLQKHHHQSEAQKAGVAPPTKSVGQMLSGVKVDRSRRGAPGSVDARRQGISDDNSSGGGVLQSMMGPQSRKPRRQGQMPHVPHLYEGPALGIFSKKVSQIPVSSPSLFDKIEEEERNQLANFPPENAFEEMAQWTREGKMWKYPIDNEQGWEEEANVPFHEHVFLDRHMTGFPDLAPIRHFMELVLVGLSKNPYMSVQQKVEHIDWFRDYFQEKKPILDEYIKNAQVQKASVAQDEMS